MAEYLTLFVTHLHYAGIVLVLLAGGFGAPIPEDIPLLTAGYLCGRGDANIFIMLPLTFAAVLGADTILYYLGKTYGHHVPRLPLFKRYLTPKRLAKAEMAFRGHGGKTLFTSRFVPGVRAAVFFTAGVFRIPLWKMLAFDGSAALISVPTLVLAGYFGANQLKKVEKFAGTAQAIIGLIAVIAVVGFIIHKWRQKHPPPGKDQPAEE